MGEGVEDVGALVKKSRNRGRVPEGFGHEEWRRIRDEEQLHEAGLAPTQGDNMRNEGLEEAKLS
jgi:hypothetical protein